MTGTLLIVIGQTLMLLGIAGYARAARKGVEDLKQQVAELDSQVRAFERRHTL